jgi:hypothetical protein
MPHPAQMPTSLPISIAANGEIALNGGHCDMLFAGAPESVLHSSRRRGGGCGARFGLRRHVARDIRATRSLAQETS